MNTRKIIWKKSKISSGIRHEGSSAGYGPYVIEKDETRSFRAWWGHFEIGNAENVMTARAIAQAHCNQL